MQNHHAVAFADTVALRRTNPTKKVDAPILFAAAATLAAGLTIFSVARVAKPAPARSQGLVVQATSQLVEPVADPPLATLTPRALPKTPVAKALAARE